MMTNRLTQLRAPDRTYFSQYECSNGPIKAEPGNGLKSGFDLMPTPAPRRASHTEEGPQTQAFQAPCQASHLGDRLSPGYARPVNGGVEMCSVAANWDLGSSSACSFLL